MLLEGQHEVGGFSLKFDQILLLLALILEVGLAYVCQGSQVLGDGLAAALGVRLHVHVLQNFQFVVDEV